MFDDVLALSPRTIEEKSIVLQRIATEAAEALLAPTWVTAIFAIVASAILLATLRETQKVTAVTRRIGEAQTRGYLRVEPRSLFYIDDNGAMDSQFQNDDDSMLSIGLRVYGTTPLHGINIDFSVHEETEGIDVDTVSNLEPRFFEFGGYTLFSDQVSTVRKGGSLERKADEYAVAIFSTNGLPDEYVERRRDGTAKPLLVSCSVTWYDVFENGFSQQYVFREQKRYDGRTGIPLGIQRQFAIVPHGKHPPECPKRIPQ